MRLMKYTNEHGTASETVDALYMDGYSFGDRLLEGVPFKLTIEGGVLKAECIDKYDEGINWPYWEKKCIEFALQDDAFSTSPKLDDDDGFIDKEE